MHETADPDLQRISISNYNENEFLMIVEKQNFADDSLAYFGFFLVFCVIIAIGCFGPPFKLRIRKNQDVSESFDNIFSSITDISPQMETLELAIQFAYLKNASYFRTNCQVVMNSNEHMMEARISNLSFYPTINHKAYFPQVLFSTRYLNFDTISTKLSCGPDIPASTLQIEWKVNRSSSVLYHLILRICFPVTLFICIIMRIYRALHGLKATREQCYTFVLTVCTILADNPLYLFHLAQPNRFIMLVNRLLLSLYEGYHSFFVTSLFINLSLEEHQLFTSHHLPFALFGIVVGVVTFLQLQLPEIEFHPYYNKYPTSAAVLEITNIALLFWQAYANWQDNDSMKRYRWLSYLLVIAGFTVITTGSRILFTVESEYLHGTAIEMITPMGLMNLFSLVMEYLHACYMASIDHAYQETDEEEDSAGQFVPETDPNQMNVVEQTIPDDVPCDDDENHVENL